AGCQQRRAPGRRHMHTRRVRQRSSPTFSKGAPGRAVSPGLRQPARRSEIRSVTWTSEGYCPVHFPYPRRPLRCRPALALVLSWVCAAQAILAQGQAVDALPDDRQSAKEHADATRLTAQTDRLFAAWDQPGSPGGALAVVRDGKVVYQRGYGTANLEYGIP